jgi:PKD repeat protein
MKKILLSTIFACLAAMAWAQITVTVSGTVVFGQDEQPAPDYPVWINSTVLDSTGANQNVVFTNENGVYTGVAVIGPDLSLFVSTFDFCIGEVVAIVVNINGPVGGNLNNLNFHVCQEILPPPPPDGCAAFFVAEPADSNSLTILFHDLSFSESPIESWAWDFGDGNTAEGPAPQHTYEAEGMYIVTLTITSDSCTATFTGVVYAGGDGDPCICPDVYDPVCIATPNGGGFITFSNACEAECAGFTPDMFVQCDSTGCVCPQIYAPVCVVSAVGDTLTFVNQCYAECEGYTADETFSCDPNDPCDCDLIYDPVCVLGPDGLELHFPNACVAECAGFTVDDFVNCAPDTFCVCPQIYAPVCVISAIGDTLTFVNQCYAECEGYTADQTFSCDPVDPCDCNLIYAPVCIVLPDGTLTTFPNACFAECAGFTPDAFVDCDSLHFPDCYAAFYTEGSDPSSLTVQFTDVSYAGDGTITSWNWHFGDPAGSTSTEQNPAHLYDAPGVYDITLTISTSDSCTSTTTQHICIGGGGIVDSISCQAMFYFTQEDSLGSTFQFQDMSFGNVNSWLWNFGDGTTSTEQNPTHSYTSSGVFVVTLTVSGDDCQSSVSMLIFTGDNIWYGDDFSALFVPFIDGLQVFFLNLSTPGGTDPYTYEWNFGDGNTSNDFMPIHTYAEAGVYTVTLTVTDANGVQSTFTATLNLITNEFTGRPQFLSASSTNETAERVSGLRAFPNPVSEQLTMEFDARSQEVYRISILTLDGREVQSAAAQMHAGRNQVTFDTRTLEGGMYLLRLQTGSEVRTLKFVKVR